LLYFRLDMLQVKKIEDLEGVGLLPIQMKNAIHVAL
jgi:hypothetical protein